MFDQQSDPTQQFTRVCKDPHSIVALLSNVMGPPSSDSNVVAQLCDDMRAIPDEDSE